MAPVIKPPFQLALDIIEQVDVKNVRQLIDIIQKPIVEKHAGLDYEYWIDYDSIGNVARLKAKYLADFLVGYLNKITFIILIKINQFVSEDNLAMIDLINKIYPEVIIHVIGCDKTINQFDEVEYVDIGINSINENSPSDFNVRSKYVDFFSGNNQSNQLIFEKCIDADKHLPFIMQYAWTLTHFDAIELAKTIFEECFKKAEINSNKMNYLLCLQVARVGLQQYDQVMRQDYPLLIENKQTKEALIYSKAYAGVLSRNFVEAGKYFAELGVEKNIEIKAIEDLYRLNIYALYLFHEKKKDDALFVEKMINNNLSAFSQNNTIFIEYINYLNLSRVYRANNDFVTAKKYCDLAYQSIDGLKTESDLVYKHLNDGMLYESLADLKNAFFAWLRSALYWQTMSCQESLAWRPYASLIGKSFRFDKKINTNEIDNIYLNKISGLARANNINLSEEIQSRIFFKKFDPSQHTDVQYIGCDGVSVLIGSEQNGANHTSECLFEFLIKVLQSVLNFKFQSNSVILIDADRGFGMPLTQAAVSARSFMLGLPSYRFNDAEIMHGSASCNPELCLSPAILKLDIESSQPVAQFKRYHSDKSLGPSESALLSKILPEGNHKLQALLETFEFDNIRKLYDLNILTISNKVA